MEHNTAVYEYDLEHHLKTRAMEPCCIDYGVFQIDNKLSLITCDRAEIVISCWSLCWTMTESESTISCTMGCLRVEFTRLSVRTTAFVKQRRIKFGLVQVGICKNF